MNPGYRLSRKPISRSEKSLQGCHLPTHILPSGLSHTALLSRKFIGSHFFNNKAVIVQRSREVLPMPQDSDHTTQIPNGTTPATDIQHGTRIPTPGRKIYSNPGWERAECGRDWSRRRQGNKVTFRLVVSPWGKKEAEPRPTLRFLGWTGKMDQSREELKLMMS